MNLERWAPVREFPGMFEVSDIGRVRSLTRKLTSGRRWGGRLLRPRIKRMGYLHVRLCADRHYWRAVHRLVLESFVGPCPALMEACHNNGVPDDNRLENLRWDTRKNNHRDKHIHGTALIGERNPLAKLTTHRVREIRALSARGVPGVVIADLYDVTPANISCITRGYTWRHIS